MLLVISPYRDREKNLAKFIPALSTFLEDRGIDYHIIISEQDNDLPFNRGLLKNIGFQYAVDRFPEGYCCFHDIDMYPTRCATGIDFSAPEDNFSIYHLYGEVDSLGAIILTTRNAFSKINGYPNDYWAWGFEDTALIQRSLRVGVRIDRSRFVHRLNPLRCVTEGSHDRPERRHQSGTIANGDSMFTETVYPDRCRRNGLLTCRDYRINSVETNGRVTRLRSDFGYSFENVLVVSESECNRQFLLCLLSEVHRFALGTIDAVFVRTEESEERFWNRFLIVEPNPQMDSIQCRTVVVVDGPFLPASDIHKAFETFGEHRASDLNTGFREYRANDENDLHVVLKSRGARNRFLFSKRAGSLGSQI